MTQLVASGVVVDPLGHCAIWRGGRLDGFAIPPRDFVKVQRAVRVTVEHRNDPPVGRLVALERDRQGRLWATAVLDELQLLREPAIYWSAEIRQTGRGDVTLTGLSVVAEPGAVGTRPLELSRVS